MSSKTISPTPKLYDTDNIAKGGKIDDHWIGQIYSDVFSNSRTGKKLPTNFRYDDQKAMLQYFNLKSFEYGNWLNQRDRYQYLTGCTVSLFDMADICRFKPKQVGLAGKLCMAFGARGNGGALAHFEPSSNVINLTRYSDNYKAGDRRFLNSGGVGSLGHEWAHAMDFYLGRFKDKSTPLNFLSHIITGRMVRRGEDYFEIREKPTTELTKAFFELMLRIIYEPVTGLKGVYKYNSFYKPLYDKVQQSGSGLGEYWILKHELFARAFEVYLFYKGLKRKISNPFLKKTKYQAIFYSSQTHFKTWEAQMDKVISLAAKAIPTT